MRQKKLLIVVNVDWFFISHRMEIAKQAKKSGWIVYVACQDTGKSIEIERNGLNFIHIPFSRSGTNLINEINSIYSLFKIYKELKPDVIHQVSLKPVIYGSLIARILKINGVLNALSGLGYNFTNQRQTWIQRILITLMKIGFSGTNSSVIFQNQDDFALIQKLKITSSINKIYFIKGSGVDLSKFKQTEFRDNSRVQILFPARMLKDKGIEDLREASKILKEKFYNKIIFILAGFIDKENKAGVSTEFIHGWEEDNYVRWIGHQENMIEVYINSDIVVLPSYREGMPKSLIEGCAIGRPIVTTHAPGCKECVDEGINGLKVPIKSPKELANALEKLIVSKDLRKEMGKASRKKAEEEFCLNQVIKKHLTIYNEVLKKSIRKV